MIDRDLCLWEDFHIVISSKPYRTKFNLVLDLPGRVLACIRVLIAVLLPGMYNYIRSGRPYLHTVAIEYLQSINKKENLYNKFSTQHCPVVSPGPFLDGLRYYSENLISNNNWLYLTNIFHFYGHLYGTDETTFKLFYPYVKTITSSLHGNYPGSKLFEPMILSKSIIEFTIPGVKLTSNEICNSFYSNEYQAIANKLCNSIGRHAPNQNCLHLIINDSKEKWIKPPPPDCQQPRFNKSLGFPQESYYQYYRHLESHRRNPHITTNLYHADILYSDLSKEGQLNIPILNELEQLCNQFTKIFSSANIDSSYKDSFEGLFLNFQPGFEWKINKIDSHISKNFYNISIVLQTNHLREMACWRLLPCFLTNNKVIILNGRSYNSEHNKYSYLYNNEPLFSVNMAGSSPLLLRYVIVNHGYLRKHYFKFLNLIINFSDVYGSDEMFLHQFPSITHCVCKDESQYFIQMGHLDTELPAIHTSGGR